MPHKEYKTNGIAMTVTMRLRPGDIAIVAEKAHQMGPFVSRSRALRTIIAEWAAAYGFAPASAEPIPAVESQK